MTITYEQLESMHNEMKDLAVKMARLLNKKCEKYPDGDEQEIIGNHINNILITLLAANINRADEPLLLLQQSQENLAEMLMWYMEGLHKNEGLHNNEGIEAIKLK